MQDSTDSVMIHEIRQYLALLDNHESLHMIPPNLLVELYKAVTTAGRLVKAVRMRQEVDGRAPIPTGHRALK